MKTEYFKFSLKNLRRRKLRSGLTLLGIIIAIAAIFVLISVSLGLEEAVQEQFRLLGTDKFFVQARGMAAGPGAGGAVLLTTVDVDTLEKVTGVKDVSFSVIGNAKIEYKDEDINRLYFLLYRLLKSALIDSHFAEKLSLSNAEILGRWYLIVNLENVADCGKNICKILSSLEKNQDKEKLKELYHQIQESYELAMKSFFSKNKNSADDVAKRRIPLFDVCDSYFEKNKTAQTALLIEQFKSMESLICNIARIVIDHE